MATIVLMPFHWAANLNATWALARRLRQRGHRVVYLCIPDSEDRVRRQGFEVRPLFAEAFPPGSLDEQYSNESQGRYAGLAGFRERILGMCEAMAQGEIEKALGGLRPDLFLVASVTPWVGIGAWTTGVPTATFSSSLISVWDPAVPPFETALIPGRGFVSRLRNRLAWRRLFLLRKLLDPQRLKIFDDVRRFAERCGYPVEEIDFRVETWPALRLPNLVFCPPELDFPRERLPPGTVFVEPSVDTGRRDPTFPWERLRPDLPLVYCALGSIATFKFTKEAARFFQAFLDALAERPHWQGVVAIGRYLDAGAFRCPNNVLLVAEAPQLEVLERASLMVSHGGFSSVKECIFQGVPMVLLPLLYDLPGTAARVVHQGLGVLGSCRGATPQRLGEWMDAVMSDPSYKERVQRMARIFRDREERAPGVEMVERLLKAEAPGPPAAWSALP